MPHLVADSGRRPKTELERELDERAAQQRKSWAQLHPHRAAEERALRKSNIAKREAFSHKRNGTPETHAHAAQRHQGALSRLYMSGAIEDDHLAAGDAILIAHERITSEVSLRTASLETRVDQSKHGGAFWEALGAVRLEAAYSAWRAQLGPSAAVTLSIVVDDIGITEAAHRHHMHVRKAKRLLIVALELWLAHWETARRDIDPATLLAAQAAIL